MKNLVMAILACMLAIPMQAQTVVQPKIMVIPYTKEGEDIRTVLEADENKRIVGDGMRTTRTKRTKTDLKFKFVLANPMTGKVKKSVFHPSSHSINKYFVV